MRARLGGMADGGSSRSIWDSLLTAAFVVAVLWLLWVVLKYTALLIYWMIYWLCVGTWRLGVMVYRWIDDRKSHKSQRELGARRVQVAKRKQIAKRRSHLDPQDRDFYSDDFWSDQEEFWSEQEEAEQEDARSWQ